MWDIRMYAYLCVCEGKRQRFEVPEHLATCHGCSVAAIDCDEIIWTIRFKQTCEETITYSICWVTTSFHFCNWLCLWQSILEPSRTGITFHNLLFYWRWKKIFWRVWEKLILILLENCQESSFLFVAVQYRSDEAGEDNVMLNIFPVSYLPSLFFEACDYVYVAFSMRLHKLDGFNRLS